MNLNSIHILSPKKILVLLVLLGLFSLHAQWPKLEPAVYPTNATTGTPVSISSGVGCTTVNVVTGIELKDKSINGWTLTITSTNGISTQPRLQHVLNGTTIDYSLEINNITGTLANGLTQSPAANTTLVFNANSTIISPTGTPLKNARTLAYTFDLRMSIANAATIGKLAGNYTDQLTLILASDD